MKATEDVLFISFDLSENKVAIVSRITDEGTIRVYNRLDGLEAERLHAICVGEPVCMMEEQ